MTSILTTGESTPALAINHKAPVKCSKTITIKASSSKVWAVLASINSWPAWQTEILNAHLNGELKPKTTFDWKSGGVKICSTLHTVEPGRQIGWTGKAFGTFAIHNWSLIEKDGQTEVVVDESMEGFLPWLLKKPLTKNLESGMEKWLTLLKKECEKY